MRPCSPWTVEAMYRHRPIKVERKGNGSFILITSHTVILALSRGKRRAEYTMVGTVWKPMRPWWRERRPWWRGL